MDRLEDDGNEPPFLAFQHFPKSIYHDIQPGATFELFEKELEGQNWTKQSGLETCIYEQKSDSTTIIFQNYEKSPATIIGELKIFLRSKTYINQPEAFLNFLEEQSDIVRKNEAFTILIVQNPIPLKVTVFTQPDFIRLFISS